MKKRIVLVMLTLALTAGSLCGCGQTNEPAPSAETVAESSVESSEASEEASEESSEEEISEEATEEETSEEETSAEEPGEEVDVTVLGEGSVSFMFNVVNANKETSYFQINTDETTVGAALLNLGLIEGEDSEYGLYVKTVNGITADYTTDGVYWAFYIDGEYAMTGVDSTEITAGATYTFAVE